MPTPIKPKRSYTATNVPSGLSSGELAVNAADGKVWIGSSDGKSNVLISSLSLSDMAGTTSNVTEGSNLYYTDSRARLSLSAGTGISYDNKTGAITNSSPDQTVVLTAGTGISTSGTYPNFTITNSSPDQTVKLTSGTGISITGTYPEFTITNSSPSSGGTVTSVGLTAPTGMKVTGSPVTGSGTLALAMDTGYALPTTASQTNWDSAYTNRITSLTTTGSSGSATLVSNTLNVPTYTLAGLGGQASSTNLTSLAGLSYVSAAFVKMTAAGTFSLDTSTYLTTNQSITLSGDVTGSGTTAITTTLATVSIAKGGTGQTTKTAAYNALTPMTTLGDLEYYDGTNAVRLAGSTSATKAFLSQTGTGTLSAAPAWSTVSKSDVGLSAVENTALSTWAGSSNITTTGTIGTGTWNATAIGLSKGGTNANITATNGGIIYSTASALAVTAAGTSGQLLQSNGAAAPTWVSTVSGLTVTGLKETKTAPAISTGTLTLDCSVGNVFAVSLNANITTLSFTNVPATGTAFGLTLMLTADGTARTITWGNAVKWAGGTAPTLTSTNAKVDVFVLVTHDGGTTWYAFTSGQNL